MKKQIKKDAKHLILVLLVGSFSLIIGFVCAFICCADSWFESIYQCFTVSGKFGLLCGEISAVATLLFPSTVKSFIRWTIKQGKSE